MRKKQYRGNRRDAHTRRERERTHPPTIQADAADPGPNAWAMGGRSVEETVSVANQCTDGQHHREGSGGHLQ
jgi:hypothetical protein